MNQTKKYLLYLCVIVIIIAAIVICFGRMEFHNELERKVMPDTLIGYIDEERHFDSVTITANDWPEWAEDFERPESETLTFEYDIYGGRIGIFADIVYYENRYELRSWFSGKLLEQASEYYYKPEGTLYLKPVYELYREPEIPLDELVPQQYDFMAFDGKVTV